MNFRTPILNLGAAAAAVVAVQAHAPAAIAQEVQLQAELDALARQGGGRYAFAPGARVMAPEGLIVPPGVDLDLNGGQIVAVLSRANAAGVKLSSRSAVRNGTVTVVSRGQPGTQAGAHAAILVGGLVGDNTVAARPSSLADPVGWTISNVTVTSDKQVSIGQGIVVGAAGIQVNGGARQGLIEGVRVPDSARMAGGVMLDWSAMGPITSGDIPGSARHFAAGRGWTTHPHDIIIRDVTVGRLSRPSIAGNGTFGVRLSGVHDVSVSNVSVARVTEAAFFHTVGDLGFEFARPDDRARGARGIVVDSLSAEWIDGGYLVRSDSYADNVGRAAAAGYRPRVDPLVQSDIIVRNVRGNAVAGRPASAGLRLDHQRGGVFSDFEVRGFARGIYVDEQVYDVTIERPIAIDSGEAGVAVGHPYRPPADVRIVSPQVRGRGAAGVIRVDRSDRVQIAGAPANVRVAADAREAKINR